MMDEIERAAILKLAELVESGSIGMTQITGQYHDGGGGCDPLGAATLALGRTEVNGLQPLKHALGVNSFPAVNFLPEQISYMGQWFDDPQRPMTIDAALIFANDCLGWSFGQMVIWMRDIAQSG